MIIKILLEKFNENFNKKKKGRHRFNLSFFIKIDITIYKVTSFPAISFSIFLMQRRGLMRDPLYAELNL